VEPALAVLSLLSIPGRTIVIGLIYLRSFSNQRGDCGMVNRRDCLDQLVGQAGAHGSRFPKTCNLPL
jgi:hypothetical protein